MKCVSIYGKIVCFHCAHTSVQSMCPHTKCTQHKMNHIPSRTRRRNRPSTPMSSRVASGEIFVSFYHPGFMFHSNRMSPKYSTAPQIPQVFSSKGLGPGTGREGTVSGCEKKGDDGMAVCCLCLSFLHLHGRLGGTSTELWCHPSWFWLRPHPTAKPTGSFAAVTQLLSRSPPPPSCMCVFVCSYLLLHMLLPIRLRSLDMNFGSNELQAVSLPSLLENSSVIILLLLKVDNLLIPALFLLSRTTSTSSSGPAASLD